MFIIELSDRHNLQLYCTFLRLYIIIMCSSMALHFRSNIVYSINYNTLPWLFFETNLITFKTVKSQHLLYCELYASTALRFKGITLLYILNCTLLQLYALKSQHLLHCELYASTALRFKGITLLYILNCTLLQLYALKSQPLLHCELYASMARSF